MTTDRLVTAGRRLFPGSTWCSRRRWAAMVLTLLVAVGACSTGSSSTERAQRSGTATAMPDEDRARPRTPEGAATLSNLTGMDQLQALFDEHQDVPRLILLLSPT